jgi:hypothetical protein
MESEWRAKGERKESGVGDVKEKSEGGKGATRGARKEAEGKRGKRCERRTKQNQEPLGPCTQAVIPTGPRHHQWEHAEGQGRGGG